MNGYSCTMEDNGGYLFTYIVVVTLLKFKTSAILLKAKCSGMRWVSCIKTYYTTLITMKLFTWFFSQKLDVETVLCSFSISNLQGIWYAHFNIYLNKPGIFRLYIDENYQSRLGMLRVDAKDLISKTISWHFSVTIASHL